jgi:hypothetical protein
VACAILEEEGSIEHMKGNGAMHFNIPKACFLYTPMMKKKRMWHLLMMRIEICG